MRGNVNYQVQQLYACVSRIGMSKHEAKEAAKASGAVGSHQIAKQTGIHGYGTADTYRAVWRDLGEYVKAEFGIKSSKFDMSQLRSEHVASFLESKINDDVKKSYFGKVCSAIEKLEVAINAYNKGNNPEAERVAFDLSCAREAGRDLEAFSGSRAYLAPAAVVAGIEDPAARLAAAVMHEGGPRIREACHIRSSQLLGVSEDKYTGTVRGFLRVESGKGGKEYTVPLSPETYRSLVSAVAAGNGLFSLATDHVREEIKEAAAKVGEEYTGKGAHGLRWSCVAERMEELQAAGMTYEQGLTICSAEKGHSRSSITEHYLGR